MHYGIFYQNKIPFDDAKSVRETSFLRIFVPFPSYTFTFSKSNMPEGREGTLGLK